MLLWQSMQIPCAKEMFESNGKKSPTTEGKNPKVELCCSPEFKSRPGLKALLLTVVESLSQLMVLETLVLKFPSNLEKTNRISNQTLFITPTFTMETQLFSAM